MSNLNSESSANEAEESLCDWEPHNQLGDPEICPNFLDAFRTPPGKVKDGDEDIDWVTWVEVSTNYAL